MPTTVLVATSVDSLDSHHTLLGGTLPTALSDASNLTGYTAVSESFDVDYYSYFNTQGLAVSAYGPFSNAQCFGFCHAADGTIPYENAASVGLHDGGAVSLWNRVIKIDGVEIPTADNAYASSPFSGSFTLPTTAAGINAVRIAIHTFKGTNSNNSREIYEAYWKVDHFASRGMMVAMIFQWLGPLVAVGLEEMPRIAREVFRRSRTLIRPDEYRQAWADLCAYRHPRRLLLRDP